MDLFSGVVSGWRHGGAYGLLLPPNETPQQVALLLFSSSSSVARQRMLSAVRLAGVPKTISESVPSVSDAFRPTASVSGASACSGLPSHGGGGCGVVEASDGSRKGSSPAPEAMIIADKKATGRA